MLHFVVFVILLLIYQLLCEIELHVSARLKSVSKDWFGFFSQVYFN